MTRSSAESWVIRSTPLRAVLPSGLTSRLDLDRLARVPSSFVDDALRWRHADLLFTCPMDDKDAFIYVLVEHQSSTDQLMAYRMLRYTVRIWDRYLVEHPDTTRLPIVIPLVVHHNRRRWSAPDDLAELIDGDPDTLHAVAASGLLPRFRFLLDDLNLVDETALQSRPLNPPARMTLLLLKIVAGNTQLVDDLQPWDDQFRAILDAAGGYDVFIALVTYIELVGEASADDLQRLFASVGPEAEEAYLTTADTLRAEGEARGRAEGEARGRSEALVQLLSQRFGPVPSTALDTIHAATTAQLEAWTARVLTAGSLEDVLR